VSETTKGRALADGYALGYRAINEGPVSRRRLRSQPTHRDDRPIPGASTELFSAVKPNVVVSDIRLRGLAVAGTNAAGRKSSQPLTEGAEPRALAKCRGRRPVHPIRGVAQPIGRRCCGLPSQCLSSSFAGSSATSTGVSGAEIRQHPPVSKLANGDRPLGQTESQSMRAAPRSRIIGCSRRWRCDPRACCRGLAW
jgi:hypothetical protein